MILEVFFIAQLQCKHYYKVQHDFTALHWYTFLDSGGEFDLFYSFDDLIVLSWGAFCVILNSGQGIKF